MTSENIVSVSEEIHAKDQMFTGNMQRYLAVGANGMQRIRQMLSIANLTPSRILDLGCGCGRVARHLRACYPSADLVVSDLMPHAVDFCARTFDATGHVSKRDFSDDFNIGFDLIWSGSVMTHIPEVAAVQMFDFMVRSLNEGGVAVWTTHGRHVERRYRSGMWPYKLSDEGFSRIVEAFCEGRYAYTDYEHMTGYGISMTPLSWLAVQAGRYSDIRTISVLERGWDEHQDVMAIVKSPIF